MRLPNPVIGPGTQHLSATGRHLKGALLKRHMKVTLRDVKTILSVTLHTHFTKCYLLLCYFNYF